MRKVIIYYILGTTAIIVLWLGIRYLTIGHLTITTNIANGSIALFKLGDENHEEPVGESVTKTLSKDLRPGKYLVKVSNKSFSAHKIVYVKARRPLRYALNSKTTSDLEPVYPSAAESIVASNSVLLYVERHSKALYKIDDQNNVLAVDETHRFNTINWGDESYGVGRDDKGQFYSVNNGSVVPLNVPFATTDLKAVFIAVSSNKQLFIAHGSDVYSGTGSGGFKKLTTTKSPSPSLASLGNKVAVLDGPGDIYNRNVPPLITVLDKSGRVLAKKAVEAQSAAWSQDGKYLALTGEGAEIEIVNGSLGDVSSLPVIGTVGSFVWSGSSLYYTVGEGLWSYDVLSETSLLAASTTPGSKLSDAVLSTDKSYIYLTLNSDSGSEKSQIYRLPLRGQKVPNYVYELPVILPDSSTPCLLSYVNFTHPTIIGANYLNPNQICPDAVKTVFEPYDIDTSLLHYHFSQASRVEEDY